MMDFPIDEGFFKFAKWTELKGDEPLNEWVGWM
jgi:hypothetical protein